MTIVKKLSKVIGLAAIGALFSVSVFANVADHMAKKDEMMASLNLTPEQTTQVDKIMADSHAKRKAIMEDPQYKDLKGKAKMEAMGPAVKTLHDDTQKQLAAVLTADQMKKVEEYQAEMLEKMRTQN
jgi:Spy/CpxP family protein refolding chaperone